MDKINYKFYGNELIYKTLTLAANSGRLCHAYLFIGDEGLGKKTLACHIAAAVLCKSEVKPCYSCTSCKKVFTGTHPDFYLYDKMLTKGSFHKDVIQKIRAEAYIMPNESQFKIYVLSNAQNMTIGAFNSFLKVLEEPPSQAIFILTAPNKASVPATIVSRCICYCLSSVSDEDCLEAVTSICPDKSAEEIKSTISLASGNIGNAIDILQNGDYAACVKTVKDIANSLVTGSEYNLLLAFSSCQTNKLAFLSITEQFILFLKETLLVQIGAKTSNDELTSKLAFKLTQNQIYALIDVIIKAKENMESNLSLQLNTNWICSNIFTIIN